MMVRSGSASELETDGRCLLTQLRSLCAADGVDYAHIVGQLDQWCKQVSEAGALEDRKLRRVLKHAIFLLREGSVLSALHQAISSPGAAALRLETVTLSGQGLRKVTVHIAQSIGPDHAPAFDSYLGVPSVLCWVTPLVFDGRHPAGAPDQIWPAPLLPEEYGAFFQHRQSIAEALGSDTRDGHDAHQALLRGHAAQVRSDVRRWQAVLAAPADCLVWPAKSQPPYFQPVLHILPRLVGSADGASPLRSIADQLDQIAAMGFGAVLLGVVDPQTVDVYYGETDRGNIVATYNDHGYWSTGQAGIDPQLGTSADYCALAARIRSMGLELIQDAVFATLGYPAQLPRFAAASLNDPAGSVVLGQVEVPVTDPIRFIHDGAWLGCQGVAGEGEQVESTVQAQLATFFALPRPNLFLPDVLDAVLQRSRWQSREAGIGAFRIDMAKHIPFRQLAAILRALRAMPRASATPFRVLLEYLSTDYCELACALAALEDQCSGAYFYDFPLAAALHRIFVAGESMPGEVKALLERRRRAPIPLRALVPTFIDHDSLFKPIYDGTKETQAAVVAGYALGLLLSANGPVVYMAYAQARAAAAGASRCSVTSLVGADPGSPAPALARLFAAVAHSGLIEHWDGSDICCNADAAGDAVRLQRYYRDPHSGRRRCVEAIFSRMPACEIGTVLFHFEGPPSVVIRERHCA